MNIEPYITQLLYRYQCVTIPGFGAFLTEIQSAQLIESSNSFSPPRKLVSFNAFLQNNDGLLANHIAQSEKTSYEYAVSAIEYEVFNWKKILQESGLFSIKNVGNFLQNVDGRIVFTPFDQPNYLASSFGLNAFVSPTIKREVYNHLVETLDVKPVEKFEENVVFADFEPEKTRSRSYLKYAAIFVLGLGLAGSIGYPMYQNQLESERLLVQTKVQKQIENKIQEATFFIQSPIPTVTLTVKEAKLPYHIVAGAFRKEYNAQKTLNKLIALGYDARRIAPNKYGLYPVLCGSFATYKEAEKAKFDFQRKHNPDAWLLIESL